MKNNLRIVSVIMLFSIIFSASLFVYKLSDVIIPSFGSSGTAGICDYTLCVLLIIAVAAKAAAALMGLSAFSSKTTYGQKIKRLTLSGKLALAVMLCGVFSLATKLIFGDGFLVIDVFDIALDILLGLMFVICSLYVRAGRED